MLITSNQKKTIPLKDKLMMMRHKAYFEFKDKHLVWLFHLEELYAPTNC